MRYSAAGCRAECVIYLYLWKHSHTDCGPTISHNALWCPVWPVWANLQDPEDETERGLLFLCLSLLNTFCLSLALFHIFFSVNLITPLPLLSVVFCFCWSGFGSVCQVEIITAGTVRFVQELHFFILLHLCPSQLSEGDCSQQGKAENRLLVPVSNPREPF